MGTLFSSLEELGNKKLQKMNYLNVIRENEELKKTVENISKQFNDHIMREKEFKALKEDLEYHKEHHEHYRIKCERHEKTIEYLRNQIQKKNRVCDAKKKTIDHLRKRKRPSNEGDSSNPASFLASDSSSHSFNNFQTDSFSSSPE